MCFGKSNTFSLIDLSRSFLPSVLGSICTHRSLLLALVLNTSSHASYSKGDVNVTSLRGLIKAIFLFKGAKRRDFGYKSYKRRLTAFGC